MDSSTVQETKTIRETPTGQVETHTVKTQAPLAGFFVSKINQVIMSIAVIIDIMLALRFLFLLLGANQVGIVNFIILVTEIFVAPFRGIFSSPAVGGAYFDLASILAIAIWTIFAVILGIIINMFSTKQE